MGPYPSGLEFSLSSGVIEDTASVVRRGVDDGSGARFLRERGRGYCEHPERPDPLEGRGEDGNVRPLLSFSVRLGSAMQPS